MSAWLCGLAVATLLLTACAQAPATELASEDGSEPVSTAQEEAGGEDGGDPAVTAPDDAAELRTTFEKLLGHHATLAARFMRSRIADDPDFFESAVSALSRNTDDLAAVVESVYDADAAESFRDLWVDHTQAFFTYATGIVEGDDDARQEARATLDAYRENFAAFAEGASAGEVQSEVVADVFERHIDDQLLGLADAFADEDYETAYELQREAYALMFPTGMDFAGGFGRHLSGETPTAFDDEPAQLRSVLGMLLGEHVELGVDVMRAAVTGAPDFEAAAGALEGNTRDLTEAIEALAGADQAERFATLWADHLDSLVAYTLAVAEDDDDARATATMAAADYEERFGLFLEDITAEEMDAGTVEEAMHVHDTQLIDQVEAYAAADYQTAHDVAFDAYQHVFATAATLAAAIESRLGEEMPVGGAATGGGGAANSGQHR